MESPDQAEQILALLGSGDKQSSEKMMTKSSNVEVIVDCMIDIDYKTYIASRCVEHAEQFAPSNQWFIQVAHNLMKLIAEGFGVEDDDSADSQLRSSAPFETLALLGLFKQQLFQLFQIPFRVFCRIIKNAAVELQQLHMM
ncbi:unnamed protein product [Prunus armeniaca]|uniref:Uncharacterized protein n=1 Tax=Prunus armeniaca TaxID=36596 RepID=A0A6J5TY01_PRUAR|nr:unnamed protein product [Prunus armeniaca]CAB4299015.1 unnamed protein product [Prunus armeniaca]